MLGLVLIYFVGKSFYTLAGRFDKNKWIFAILGVISYYAGIMIGGLLLGVLLAFGGVSEEGSSNILLSLLTIPIGVLACWGFYKLLEKNWKNNPSNASFDSEILDDSPWK